MTHLDTIERNAYRYAYGDGIKEILCGLLLAAASVTVRTPVGGLVALALGILFIRILPRLRDRFTAPRAGYAEVERPSARLLGGIAAWMVLIGAIVAAVSALTSDHGSPYRWIPAFVGTVIAGGFIFAARRSGLTRFYFYVAAAIGGGVTLSVLRPAENRLEGYSRLYLLMAGLAVILLAGGTTVFLRFLRRHPVHPAQVEVSDGQ